MNYIQKIGQVKDLEMGGKAHNLDILTKANINVPKAFVVSTNAYHEFTQNSLFAADLENEIETIIIPGLKSTKCMVRSSAVGEDSGDNSFAGQLESYISDISISDIKENIILCWNSAKSNRVKTYQEQNKVELGGVAVVIQEMIEADYSGVLFTTSPINDNSILLEYVEGHGEKLVQGEVNPESLEFKKHHEHEHQAPFNLNKLLSTSVEMLKVYEGIPQDIEWAAVGDDIFIVQSRPITTLQPKINWSNTNVNENYPEKLSPLLNSIARRSYYHYFKNLALELGVLDENHFESDEHFSNIIGLWGHKMYYNMSSIHSALELSPFKSLFKSSFDDFVGYQKKNESLFEYKEQFNKLIFIFKLVNHFRRLPKRVKLIENIVNEFASNQKKSQKLNELNTIHHQFLNIRFNKWINASFADLFSMLTHGALGKICLKIDSELGIGMQNGLIQAIPNLISNQPIFRNWKIIELIKSEKMEKWFLETAAVDIHTQLKIKNQKIYLEINQYLEDFGFRCSGELTMFLDNYIERPENFIEMLQLYLKTNDSDPEILFNKKHEEQEVLLKDALELINKKKMFFINKFIFKFCLKKLVKLTCYAISCRERVRLKQALLYHHFKQNIKASARFFKFSEESFFYLEYDEISRILAGEIVDKEYLEGLIHLRKNKMQTDEETPDNFYTKVGDQKFTIYNQDKIEIHEGVIKGLPACAGLIKAPVKVLKSIHEISKLNKGDILVTQQTDPGWIYAFPIISGLIVERGGMLSHGAIVAREFGIPAVVGVANITKELKDGQIVTLDGNQGIISV